MNNWQNKNVSGDPISPKAIKFDKQMDIFDIVDAAFGAGELWVDAASIHQAYKEREKNKIATIRQNIKMTVPPPGGKKQWTRDDLDDAAFSHKDWEDYLKEWNAAYEAMLRARNNYDAWVNKLEASRSKMATDRLLHKVI
jgi:hypothetical protein